MAGGIDVGHRGSPGSSAIHTTAMSKTFASGDGVESIDLEIPTGSIFGFIGPSGAGKTTTVRLLTGLLDPSAGSVSVLGKRPRDFGSADRRRIGYMPQLSVLYPNLTVWENLRFLSSLYGVGLRREPLRRVLEFVELTDHENKRASEISGGMRRRLSLASALVHRPELVFLDEPTAGIDPVLRRKLWDRFHSLRDEGRTLFVTTQYVGEAAYCDFVGVLGDGRLLTVETPDGLRRYAYGGDIVDVEFTQRPGEAVVEDVGRHVGATSWEPTSGTSVRFIVDEAAIALPSLGSFLADRGVSIEQAEEHVPSFDDVFVEIVERARLGEEPVAEPIEVPVEEPVERPRLGASRIEDASDA